MGAAGTDSGGGGSIAWRMAVFSSGLRTKDCATCQLPTKARHMVDTNLENAESGGPQSKIYLSHLSSMLTSVFSMNNEFHERIQRRRRFEPVPFFSVCFGDGNIGRQHEGRERQFSRGREKA
jgi:hypothetical protein